MITYLSLYHLSFFCSMSNVYYFALQTPLLLRTWFVAHGVWIDFESVNFTIVCARATITKPMSA